MFTNNACGWRKLIQNKLTNPNSNNMDRKIILKFDRKEKKRKSSTKHGNEKPKSHLQRLDEVPSTTYRDRAQERREGLQRDFELDPDNFIISNPTVDGEQSIDDAERRRQQIEDSKYLGGDVEHTHLVMGLDFTLAERLKAAEKLAEKESKQDETDFLLGADDRDEEEFLKEALKAGNVAASSKRQIDLRKLRASEMIACRTALARRILNAVDQRWPERSDKFLPGRMSYVVPIDEESDSTVTTILTSKAEQGEDEDSKEKDLDIIYVSGVLARAGREN